MIKLLTTLSIFFLFSNAFAQQYGLDWALNAKDSLGNASDLWSYAQKVDNQGNVVVAGLYRGVADFDPSLNNVEIIDKGNKNLFLAKYDSQGNLLWVKDIGGFEPNFVSSIDLDSAGNIILTGFINTIFHYDAEISGQVVNVPWSPIPPYIPGHSYLMKYGANGNFMWIKSMASSQSIYSSSVHVDASGDILVTGKFEGKAYFNEPLFNDSIIGTGGEDIFLVRYTESGDFIWAKAIGGIYDDEGTVVHSDSQGNSYIVGLIKDTVDMDPSINIFNVVGSNNGFGGANFFAKYDINGNFMWCDFFADVSGSTSFNDLILDNSDNILVTGKYYNSGPGSGVDFDPGPGTWELLVPGINSAAFVAKYNLNGAFSWAQAVGASAHVGDIIRVDQNNTIYLVGTKTQFGGQTDLFLAKCDSNGNQIYLNDINGAMDNIVTGLSIDPTNNNPVLSGYFNNVTDFDPAAGVFNLTAPSTSIYAGFIGSYASSGLLNWAIKLGSDNYFGSGSSPFGDIGSYVTCDKWGSIYVSGTYIGPTDFDPSMSEAILTSPYPIGGSSFLAKYDSIGNYQWAFRLDSVSNDKNIAVDSVGNTYMVGTLNGTTDFDPSIGTTFLTSTYNSGYITKYDLNSNLIWAFKLEELAAGSSSIVYSIALDSLGSIIVFGTCTGMIEFDPGAGSSIFSGMSQTFIAKYDPNGNYLWVKFYDLIGSNADIDLAVNAKGEIFMTGAFTGTRDIDPSPSVYNIISNGQDDAFVVKYDSLGNFEWGFGFGDVEDDYGHSVVVGQEHIYVTGAFEGTIDVDPTAGVTNLFCDCLMNNFSTYLARFNSTTGNLDWAFSLTSEGWGASIPRGLDIDENENIVLSGMFHTLWPSYNATVSELDLDPSPNLAGISSAFGTYSNNFIGVYDSVGNYIWATEIPGVTSIYADSHNNRTVHFTEANEIVFTGHFVDAADFAPLDSVTYLTSRNGRDFFLAKYSVCQPSYTTESLSSCGSYTWIDNIYSSSGVYTDTAINNRGCDSIIELTLTIFPLDTTSVMITECDSYTWVNGTTYTATGIYHDNLTSINGCDSILELNLVLQSITAAATVLDDTTLQCNNTGVSYQWFDCTTESIILGANTQAYTPGYNGSFSVIVNDGLCIDTSGCLNITTIGILENDFSNDLLLYPNPTSGKVTISLGNFYEKVNVSVVDVSGRNIDVFEFNKTSELDFMIIGETGLYVIEINTSSNKKAKIKVLKN